MTSYLQDFITRVQDRVMRNRQWMVSGSEIGEAIDIARLICPLRFDIAVRIDFIRLLRDEWDLYITDFDGFLDLAESRAYYIWFHEIATARYRPQIYGDDSLVKPAFVNRVHKTARLWKLIDLNGYDPSTPIRLESGRSIQSVNGKTINATYFAGDGCHRISCLYLAGQTRLQPEHYQVRVHRHFQPLDNTALLIKVLPLDRATYLRFISRFYCGGLVLDSEDRILQRVASVNANLLPELESVLAFDLPGFLPNG